MSKVIKVSGPAKKSNYNFSGGFDDSLQESEFQKEYEETQRRNLIEQEIKRNYDKGFRDGMDSIKINLEKEFVNKLLEKTEEFSAILNGVNEKIASYDELFDKTVIELSIKIAEKILERELDKQSIISDVIRKAVKKVIGANEMVVKLNPKDYEKLSSISDKLLFDDAMYKIKFEAVDNIEIGGCLVETDIGNVDARISSQLEEIRKNLENSILSDE